MNGFLLNTCTNILRSFTGTARSAIPAIAMDVDERKKPGLFAQCSFAIIRMADFTEEQAESVSSAFPSCPNFCQN